MTGHYRLRKNLNVTGVAVTEDASGRLCDKTDKEDETSLSHSTRGFFPEPEEIASVLMGDVHSFVEAVSRLGCYNK
jgi:hypothetical protein